jgi:hypothetical protein
MCASLHTWMSYAEVHAEASRVQVPGVGALARQGA